MTSYYSDDLVTIYHGDCLPILDTIDAASVDLVIADPPYGVAYKSGANRPRPTGAFGKDKPPTTVRSHDWPLIVGDQSPFDPGPLLRFPRLVLFGANYYADRLPPSPSWIAWDKIDGLATSKRCVGINDQADAEMAWTNLGGPVRIIRHRWLGLMQASEQRERRVHPTQKPIALMERIIEWRTKPGDLVLDPYMGSGPVAVACQRLGRRYIGIEIEEKYCEVAAKRLQQGTLDLTA